MVEKWDGWCSQFMISQPTKLYKVVKETQALSLLSNQREHTLLIIKSHAHFNGTIPSHWDLLQNKYALERAAQHLRQIFTHSCNVRIESGFIGATSSGLEMLPTFTVHFWKNILGSFKYPPKSTDDSAVRWIYNHISNVLCISISYELAWSQATESAFSFPLAFPSESI